MGMYACERSFPADTKPYQSKRETLTSDLSFTIIGEREVTLSRPYVIVCIPFLFDKLEFAEE